jgi:hypothetical protein
MAMTKRKLLLVPVALVLLVFAYEGLRVWWYHGYSRGTRTGVFRKVSEMGPPYCKYLSGEMVLTSTLPGQVSETWEFSVDHDGDDDPLVKQLHEAEKSGARITLDYRQDQGSLFRCTPSEYFVVGVEK